MTDHHRDEFEAWCVESKRAYRDKHGFHFFPAHEAGRDLWDGWQESRRTYRAAVGESLREMVDMMDRGDEPGAGSEWHKKATTALATQTPGEQP